MLVPKLTVLMPVFNCENYVSEAIESILNQTFEDFEFLIIDDASTDNTVNIVKQYSDNRIRFIQKETNTGHTNSLNYGLSIAKGKYIARMDGDDVSLPTRFEKQVIILDQNPDIIVCGAFHQIIGKNILKKYPVRHDDIVLQLLRRNAFTHPSVMIRKSVFKINNICYDPSMEPVEDYDLWVSLVPYGKFYNIPEILLWYRVHDNQVSARRYKEKFNRFYEIREKLLKYLDLSNFTNEELVILRSLQYRKLAKYEDLDFYESIKTKLIIANDNKGIFQSTGLKRFLEELAYLGCKDIFLGSLNYYPKLIRQYFVAKRQYNFKIGLENELKLIIKSAISYKSRKRLTK